eukprot:8949779-Pyramimonas_sp.AAC.1
MSSCLFGARWLICVVRKSDLCKCGCRGFCALGPVLRAIAWAFSVLQSGVYPATYHLGMPFSDPIRAAKRGFEFARGWVGVLSEMRAGLFE